MIPKPTHCQLCPLYGSGLGFSNLEGSGESGLLVLAEALGEHEEDDGLPLRPHAPAGSVFQRALRDSNIRRNDLLISNIVRCRPPGNELLGAPYEREAIDHCSAYLNAAVAQYKPSAILALGGTPLHELTPYRGIMSHRGFILNSRFGIPLVATYHPALLVRGALGTLFGVFKRDVALAYQIARNGVPPPLETSYELRPTIDRCWEYYNYLRTNPGFAISYDIETADILGEKQPEDWRLKRIIQIQFSHRAGYAIVLPWEGEFITCAQRILALPNPKWGWNSRCSDDLALASNDCPVAGEKHDLMNAWGHLQPSFWGGKDDKDTDKGVPSRLMGLQSAASFYCPEVGPWKHLAANPENLPLYGAMDADYTYRCGTGILASLEKFGLMAGYRSHKLALRPVLDDLGAIGLPVDRDKQIALRQYVTDELKSLQNRIQAQVPSNLLTLHPPKGWKGIPRSIATINGQVGKLCDYVANGYNPNNPPYVVLGDPDKPRKSKAAEGRLVQRAFDGTRDTSKEIHEDEKANLFQKGMYESGARSNDSAALLDLPRCIHERVAQDSQTDSSSENKGQCPVDCTGLPEAGQIDSTTVRGLRGRRKGGKAPRRLQQAAGSALEMSPVSPEASSNLRWCLERPYNPHGSSPNTKAYIRYMGYPMPKSIDGGKDTTGKLELQKLAEKTGDEVLRLTGEWRETCKVGNDYTGGFWIPGDDGRVHAEFRFGTASAQTTAVRPPVQTYPEHSGIAKRAKEAIRAEPGHTLVKIDMRGFHARMAGWLSKDPDYYRLADFDVHSFVTAHFLHLKDAPYLLDMDDDELSAALDWVKSDTDRKYIRNYKVKRVVHGVTFGMKARKLYRMYSQNFENEREAQGLIDLLAELFPRTFLAFPNWIREQINNVSPCRLVSPFKHHRFFWDYDMEQATAFLPSNCAHCHIQAALVRLRDGGALHRYEAINFTHDALWLHPRTEDVAGCIEVVQFEFERPSDVLVDSPLGAFQCNSDAEVGYDLAHMEPWKG